MDQHQLTIVIAVIAPIVVIAVISFLLARKRRSAGAPSMVRPHSLGPYFPVKTLVEAYS